MVATNKIFLEYSQREMIRESRCVTTKKKKNELNIKENRSG